MSSPTTRFNAFNEAYFGGRLPAYTVVLFAKLTGIDIRVDGRHDRRRREIAIWRRVPNVDAVLLHEMAHAATNDHHGPRWQAEMTRLAEAGAPVDPIDLAPPAVTRLRRADVEHVASDMLTQSPDLTLEAFVAAMVVDGRVPYAGTAGAAMKAYPWIRGAFETVRGAALRSEQDRSPAG